MDPDESLLQKARSVKQLNEALLSFEKTDARKSRVVELRYFGGLSIEEIAEVLEIAPITVSREWQAARAWLAREMGVGKPHQA